MSIKISYKVLVIDDELEFLRLAAADLESCGVEVYTASNGLDAFDFIRAHPELNMIVSDIKMPGIDGIELLRRVRFDLKRNDIRYFLITAYPDLLNRDLSIFNLEEVIEKPINSDIFNRLVQI